MELRAQTEERIRGIPRPLPVRWVVTQIQSVGEKEGLCKIICTVLPVGISGHILIDTLHPNLQPCAAIGQHIT